MKLCFQKLAIASLDFERDFGRVSDRVFTKSYARPVSNMP
jgi:hypothetical protein